MRVSPAGRKKPLIYSRRRLWKKKDRSNGSFQKQRRVKCFPTGPSRYCPPPTIGGLPFNICCWRSAPTVLQLLWPVNWWGAYQTSERWSRRHRIDLAACFLVHNCECQEVVLPHRRVEDRGLGTGQSRQQASPHYTSPDPPSRLQEKTCLD